MQGKSVKPACIFNYNKNDRNETVSIAIYEIKTQLSCLGVFCNLNRQRRLLFFYNDQITFEAEL